MSNVVALCLGFCGVVLFTYLLRSGTLGTASYSTLVIATILVAIAVSRIEVLQVLDLKNLTVSMREIQQARADVQAKAEEVQKLAAGVAAFTTASIISEGRFVGLDHQERMLRRRDQLNAFLNDAGVDEKRREELITPITEMVDWDLRRAIVIDAVSAWKVPPGGSPTDSTARDVLQRELEAGLQQPDRLKGLRDAEALLQKSGVSAEMLTAGIEQYRRLIESGRLPKTGPADDLQRAPLR